MRKMTETPTSPTADRPVRPAWRTASLPWFVLAGGYLVVVAVALALASAGSWAGIAGVAVLLALVVALLRVWCEGPGPLPGGDDPVG
jgi:hypothetical protein